MSSPDLVLPDGLDALRAEFSLGDIMRLIERTARWVDPATFKILPVWYPEYARRSLFYKANWSAPQMNKNGQTGHVEHKKEGNLHANKALTHALGLRSDDRPNWSCCHIWGVDDPTYQRANAVVQDHRFFSCVANMVLLPTPLKAFTDAVPEVKIMLRICARNLYDWHCDHESVAHLVSAAEGWTDWSSYPKSWPLKPGTTRPLGVVELSDDIRVAAARRLKRIQRDLREAGSNYPQKEVRAALLYWNIKAD